MMNLNPASRCPAGVSPAAAFQVTVSVKRAPALRQPAGPGVPPGHWQCHVSLSATGPYQY